MSQNFSAISRSIRILVLVGGFLLAPLLINQVTAQSASDGFNPNLDGVVNVVLIQDDGRILIGGAFTSVRSEDGAQIGRGNLARYWPDGSLDTGFNPDLDGAVRALALQPDGRIVIGGAFSSLDPGRSGSPVTRHAIARVNADGSLDGAFDPNPGGSLTPQVFAVVVQSDGKIVFGGDFSEIQPAGASSPVTRNNLARVTASGSVDSGFAPNPDSIVYTLGVQSDGRLIVGGGFTQLHPSGGAVISGAGRIVRLNTDGSLDPGFDVIADDRVMCLLFLSDGSLVIGGDFDSIQQGVSGSRFDRYALARIQASGQIDAAFRPNANGNVSALAVQRDGRILVGGTFTSFLPSGASESIFQSYLARLNASGTLDIAFVPGPNSPVYSLGVQSDGSIVVGGVFTRFRPRTSSGSIVRNRAARLHADGSVDATSEVDAGTEIEVMVREGDGKVIIAGLFSTIGGVSRQNLGRVAPDGIVDQAYSPDTDGRVLDAVLQPDGKTVIVGEFGIVNGVEVRGIARLNADGSLDTGFDPNPNAPVTAVLLLSDGKLMIGGEFTNLVPNKGPEGFGRSNLARLNGDGTVDDSYSAGTAGILQTLSLQPDGKLLVGGFFSSVFASGGRGAVARNNIARLNEDGSVDEDFNPNANGGVAVISLQSDGKILLGGEFTSLQPNGAEEPTRRKLLARLNADGTLDVGFDPNPSASVTSIQPQSDGKVLIGGRFLFLNPNGAEVPVYRTRFARLESDGSVDTTLNLGADGVIRHFLAEGDGGALIAGEFSTVSAFTGTTGSVTGKVVRLSGADELDLGYLIRSDNPSGSQVTATALQGDGSILIGGSFSDIGGSGNRNIARVFADGNPDRSFVTDSNGPVNAILIRPDVASDSTRGRLLAWLDPDGTFHDAPDIADGSELLGAVLAVVEQVDGRLLIGGSFTDGKLQIGPFLARFNVDGSLDTSFEPVVNSTVSAIALQSDGKILIGGVFTTVNGFPRNRMARLNADGSLDTGFDPNVSNQVMSIAVQGDGKILIGGIFSLVRPNGAAAATTRSRMARFNPDGTLDVAFDPGPNDEVSAILWQDDGSIMIGGSFTFLVPNGGARVSRFRLARLLPTGEPDSVFSTRLGGEVLAIDRQPDGKYLIGGTFATITPQGATDPVLRIAIARLNADGSVDDFDPSANASVTSIHLQDDGRILVGGSFTGFTPNGQTFTTTRRRLARLNADGTVDGGFNPDADNTVFSIIDRSDGTIAVGGSFHRLTPQADLFFGGNFSAIAGVPVRNFARVNSDGSPDSSFDPQPDRPVHALALQADGRVIVAGGFSLIAGEMRNRIARFSPTGTIENGFDPNANGPVRALAIQPDGRIFVGGEFTQLGGTARHRLARLNADGGLDSSFDAEADGTVTALALQPDGMILAAGQFAEIAGGSRAWLARIRADGTLDGGFNPAPNGAVHSVALQADGRILVVGAFTAIGGGTRARVARLNADGSLDPSFRADADGEVFSVVLLESGRPFITGSFTRIAGTPRNLTARLDTDAGAIDDLSVNSSRTRITWTRGGAAPELAASFFATSDDGQNWTTLGVGRRASGGSAWEIDLATPLPADAFTFVRAQGIVPTSQNSSSGFVRTVAQFYGSIVSGPASVRSPGNGSSASNHDASRGPDHVPSGSGSGGEAAAGGKDAPGGSLLTGAIPFDWNIGAGAPGAAFLNLSSRVHLRTDEAVIAGFSIAGAESKRLLIRSVGPALALFGIDDHAVSPRLQVFDGSGQLVGENASWGGDEVLSEAFLDAGAFPLEPESLDAAIQLDLPPGAYTIRLSDRRGESGVILAEIYDLSPGSGNRLVNLSTRGPVSVGSGVATGGFVVEGAAKALVLVRAIGPGLVAFGVRDAIEDPVLHVFDVDGHLLALNDDWNAPLWVDSLYPAFEQRDLAEAQDRVGAFEIDPAGRDSVVLMTLEPGVYTAQVKSAGDTSGEAIIEVYIVNPTP